MKGKETEQAFSQRIMQKLEKFFRIETEVFSDCKSARIDALLFDRENTKPIFGVEFKKPTHKTGVFLAKYCLQAQRYTQVKFLGQNIEVAICPAISNNDFIQVLELERIDKRQWKATPYHSPSQTHTNVNSFLGTAFNICELRFIDNQPFIIKNNKTLWNPNNNI